MDPFLFSLLLAWAIVRYVSEDVIHKVRGTEAPRHDERRQRDSKGAASDGGGPGGRSGTSTIGGVVGSAAGAAAATGATWIRRGIRGLGRYMRNLWHDAKASAEDRWDNRFPDDRPTGTDGDAGFNVDETPAGDGRDRFSPPPPHNDGSGRDGNRPPPPPCFPPPPRPQPAQEPPPAEQPRSRQEWWHSPPPSPPPPSQPSEEPPPSPQRWDAQRLDDAPHPAPSTPRQITTGQQLIGGTMSTDVAVTSTDTDIDPHAALQFAQQMQELAQMLINKIDEVRGDLQEKKVGAVALAPFDEIADAFEAARASTVAAVGYFQQHVEVQDHIESVNHVGGDAYLRANDAEFAAR